MGRWCRPHTAIGLTLICHVCLQSLYLECDRCDHPRDAVVVMADAVICGSGAGGGIAAALLAQVGAKAGPFPLSSSALDIGFLPRPCLLQGLGAIL